MSGRKTQITLVNLILKRKISSGKQESSPDENVNLELGRKNSQKRNKVTGPFLPTYVKMLKTLHQSYIQATLTLS